MEPDDIPVHDLLGVGGEPDPGSDELRAIVARAGRKRWAMAGVAATLALALGLGVGYAASNQSGSPSQTQTASPASAQNTPANASAAAGASPGGSSGSNSASSSGSSAASSSASSGATPLSPSTSRFTRLFTRTAGGVTIRGFRATSPRILGLPAGCDLSGARLQVEVSTARMVGTAGSGLGGVDRSQPVSAISSEVVGSAEGAPTAVVAAATGAGVARVSVSFAGGASDAMAPVDGWVALAAPVPGSVANGSNVGTLTGRDPAGKVLTSRALQLGPEAERAATVGVFVHLPGGGAERRYRQLGGIGAVEGGLSAVAVFHPSLCRGAGERQSERCDGIAPVVGRNRRIRWLADPCYRPFGMSDASWRLRGGAEFGRNARLGRRRI